MLTDAEKETRKAQRLGNNYIYPWIGVDLDKTLAVYYTFKGEDHIGEPILKMVERVQQWLAQGQIVKIFTARESEPDAKKKLIAIQAIENWCLKNIGVVLPVTCVKDYGCVRFYDDRAVQIEENTGELTAEIRYIEGFQHGQIAQQIKES